MTGLAANMSTSAKMDSVVGKTYAAVAKQNTTSNNSANGTNNNVDPDVRPHLEQLELALQMEHKYRVGAQPVSQEAEPGTISSGMRDGSAHVLRCLKVWYDLPTDVFFIAVSSIDRFLAKMKAQPKHLSCIAVAAFHLACRQFHGHQLEQQLLSKKNSDTTIAPIAIPDPADLVTISQSRCSPSDLLRMQNIVANKLDLNPASGPEPPVTALSFLRIMFAVSKAASLRLGLYDLLPESLPDHLVHQLEILACDSLTLQHRPAVVALALLTTDFQRRASGQPAHSNALMGFVGELHKYTRVANGTFLDCLGVVVRQLENYNGEGTVTHRQRLVWKLSNRTLRHLRPTDKLRATLPTIKENSGAVNIPRMRYISISQIFKTKIKFKLIFFCRSNSECSEESMESLSASEESDEGEREMEMDTEGGGYFPAEKVKQTTTNK